MGGAIAEITVSGFRGILAPLSLAFRKGRTAQSMVIYGGNGTGKSSIADAWEWLHTGKIERLAREGAGERSYPNRAASPGDIYVEVDFTDPTLGTIRLEFDTRRVTIPKPSGPLDELRRLGPHPCHLRFEDLVRFVYLTKAERYDELAPLIGFGPQVELQKGLQRVARAFQGCMERDEEKTAAHKTSLSRHFDGSVPTENLVLEKVSETLSTQSLPRADTLQQASERSKLLDKHIEKDPRARELANIRGFREKARSIAPSENLGESLQTLHSELQDFSNKTRDSVDLFLVYLLEDGEELLSASQWMASERSGTCPLCGRDYEGDLLSHVKEELARLEELRTDRTRIEGKLTTLRGDITELTRDASSFHSQELPQEDFVGKRDVEVLARHCGDLVRFLEALDEKLDRRLKQWGAPELEELASALDALLPSLTSFLHQQEKTEAILGTREDALPSDDSRAKLVKARDLVKAILTDWRTYEELVARSVAKEAVRARYQKVLEDYVSQCLDDVEARFESISEDVETYFRFLEHRTPGLARPALRLLRDQERAVSLEIEFRGTTIEHAYGYLSQSQLNSFGLAVFLASARAFNRQLRFLLLDDIINSFDAYKRPRVVDLLKTHFLDFQFLILTHDRVWLDRLCRQCPDWVPLRFDRYEIGSGPVISRSRTLLEEVTEFLSVDKADQAGGILAPVLERELQEVSEAFEVLVKYNRRNEYTLGPLLDRFRLRVKEKLGSTHPLHAAIEALRREQGFRNLLLHWKNPESPVDAEELRIVVDRWKSVEEFVKCQKRGCGSVLHYDSNTGTFVCQCAGTCLEPGQTVG